MTATLLIHSSGLSARQWQPLLPSLRAHRRLIVPDLHGYGEGPAWPSAAHTSAIEADLHLLVALLDELEEPAEVVGHSYGGALAIFAALRRPHTVRRIVVHEPIAWGLLREHNDDPRARALFEGFEDTGFLDPERRGTTSWMADFVTFWNGPGVWEAIDPRVREGMLATQHKTFDEVRELCLDETPSHAYAGLELPVTITVGTRSPEIERLTCQLLAQALPQASLIEIAGAHMAPVRRPRAFRAELLRALDLPDDAH